MCKTLTLKKAESLPLGSNLEKSSRSDGNAGASVANSSSCIDLLELSTPALLQVEDGIIPLVSGLERGAFNMVGFPGVRSRVV